MMEVCMRAHAAVNEHFMSAVGMIFAKCAAGKMTDRMTMTRMMFEVAQTVDLA
jgi:hypothetical protein